MATTNISLIDEKIDELRQSIKVMTGRETEDRTNPTYISKSTKQTQLYHMKREKRVLHLIRTLMAADPDVKLEPDDMDTFVLVTTLASERSVSKYAFAEGDSLLDILTKYENLSRKDLDKKLEKLGLKMDYDNTKCVIKA